MSDLRKEQLVITILKMNGMLEMAENLVNSFQPALMKKYPNVDMKIVQDIFDKKGFTLYRDYLVSLYIDVFTEGELQSIIDFYGGAAGRKMCDKKVNKNVEIIQQKWLIDLDASLQKEQEKNNNKQ